MMHSLFRYRTMGFSFFIEYDLFSPVSMLFGGIICHRLCHPLIFDNFLSVSSHYQFALFLYIKSMVKSKSIVTLSFQNA